MGQQPEPGTVLELELRRRHWSREEALVELDRTARDMGVRGYALSLRQLDRWLGGAVRTPRGPACRVAERLFGKPIDILLGPVAPTPSLPAPRAATAEAGPLTRLAAARARVRAGVPQPCLLPPGPPRAGRRSARRGNRAAVLRCPGLRR